MITSVRTLRTLVLVGIVAIIASSCSMFGGGGTKPTSHDPGHYSTATGLAFNEGDTTYQVQDFEGQPDGLSLSKFCQRQISVGTLLFRKTTSTVLPITISKMGVKPYPPINTTSQPCVLVVWKIVLEGLPCFSI